MSRDPVFNFDARNHISGMDEERVAKFCMQVEYIKCLAFDDRLGLLPINGRDPFFLIGPNHIFEIGESRHFKLRMLQCTHF